jgi:hypothetical protein
VTPAFCPSEITATYDENIVDFDPETQKITIPSITDTLTPSNPNNDGSTQHEYPVVTTITVTDSDGTKKTESVTTIVVVKNPCLDSEHVSIEVATFDNLEYSVNSGAETYGSHAIFLVKTWPIPHTLCGNLVYEPRYNGEALSGQVLSYVAATRKFTVETSDTNLIGQIVPYSVIATLVNYPVNQYSEAPSAENGANILFNNPCATPISYAASTQTDAEKSDKYTGTPIVFQLNPFDIDPVGCRVTYTCTSVTDVDGIATPISCSDFTFDGYFDGQSTDG